MLGDIHGRRRKVDNPLWFERIFRLEIFKSPLVCDQDKEELFPLFPFFGFLHNLSTALRSAVGKGRARQRADASIRWNWFRVCECWSDRRVGSGKPRPRATFLDFAVKLAAVYVMPRAVRKYSTQIIHDIDQSQVNPKADMSGARVTSEVGSYCCIAATDDAIGNINVVPSISGSVKYLSRDIHNTSSHQLKLILDSTQRNLGTSEKSKEKAGKGAYLRTTASKQENARPPHS
jgi:hypothetical protein